jgi:hypothetical protein
MFPTKEVNFDQEKAEIDKIYDSIKQDISPKKISDFNRFFVDFNGYVKKLSHENSVLKQRLKSAQN